MSRKHRIRTMHLNGPLDGELFMEREGVDPDKQPDDEPEWLDNEKDPAKVLDADEEEDAEDDDEVDDGDGPNYDDFEETVLDVPARRSR